MKPALNQMRIGFDGHCRILAAVAHCSQSLDEVAASTGIARRTVARTMGYCLRAGVVHRPEWFRPCAHARMVPRFKLGRGGDVSIPMYEERFRGSVGQKAAVPHGNVLTLATLLNLMQEDRMSRLELAEAMAMHGVRVAVLTTGARKADGNPAAPITDASLASLQGMIDRLGAQFFALVAEARPVSAEEVQALEAACLMGQDAVDAGLADEVISRSALLAKLTGQETNMDDDNAEKAEAEETTEEEAKAEEAECKPEGESSEDMPEDDEEESEPEASAAAAHSSRDILAVVRKLTGQSSPAAQIGALHALATEAKRAKSLSAKLAKVEGERAKAAHAAKVDAAIKAGKLAPAQRAWALGISGEVLSGYLATVGSVAPKAVAAPAPAQANGSELSEADRKVAASLGLTAEAFSKHKAAVAAKGTIQ